MYEFIQSKYFQGLIEGFSSGVAIINSAGIIYIFNEAAASIIGTPKERALKRPWSEVFSGIQNQKQLKTLIEQTISVTHFSSTLDTRLTGLDGRLKFPTISASKLIYFDKLFGIVLEINDVSYIYEMHAHEEEILLERSEALQKMSMAVAHQFRNPLSVVGGLVSRLQKKGAHQSQLEEYFQTIRGGISRMEAIVEATYQYNQLSIDRLQPVQLHLFIRQIHEQVVELLAERNALLDWKIGLDEVTVPVDPRLFEQAVREILLNAAEPCDSSGAQITIRGSREASFYRITIMDNGISIGEKEFPFIFDPFYTTNPQKTGMGLCMVKRIIELHAGQVAIKNNAEQGVSVHLQLPLKSALEE